MLNRLFRDQENLPVPGPLSALGHLPMGAHLVLFGIFFVALRVIVNLELIDVVWAMLVFYVAWFVVCIILTLRYVPRSHVSRVFNGVPARDVWDYTMAGLALKMLSVVLVLCQLAILVRFSQGETDSLLESFGSMVPATETLFDQMLILFSAGILAPIVEEYIFRGMILNRLLRKCVPWVAVLLTSTLFGMMHPGFLYAFVLSLVLCVVAMKTQSLFGPIAIHMIFNASALIFSLGAAPTDGDTSHIDNVEAFVSSDVPWTGIAVLGAISLVVLWWFLQGRLPLLKVNEVESADSDLRI